MFRCTDCGEEFTRNEAVWDEVPDDRDQMYGRPMSGTMEIVRCPMCFSDEIEEDLI